MFEKLGIHHQSTKTLPELKGKVKYNEMMSHHTRFGVGGPADIYFEPADEKDLVTFLQHIDMPVTILGAGSNVLIRDGGLIGAVVHLPKNFGGLSRQGDYIICGAGVPNADLARFALQNELSGFEFLAGIPGTLGGALRMNAGAYGFEIKDIIESVRVMDAKGAIQEIKTDEAFLSYRNNAMPDDWIFLGATLKGTPKKAEEIAGKMAELKQLRESRQPVWAKTCGSTFKNVMDVPAWKLIEKAGCRGLRRGGAVVSEKHCNFLINDDHATAADLEELGLEVQKRVLDACGIQLEWEVKRLGQKKK